MKFAPQIKIPATYIRGGTSKADGEGLYEEKCAVCHGLFGEGEGRWEDHHYEGALYQ